MHIWQGSLTEDGYALGHGIVVSRDWYVENFGPLPEGWTVDHLCRQCACVNLDHLEAVTQAENVRRTVEAGTHVSLRRKAQTHCNRGHEFTEENTRWKKCGEGRYCKQCKREVGAKRRQKNRDAYLIATYGETHVPK